MSSLLRDLFERKYMEDDHEEYLGGGDVALCHNSLQ